MGKDTFQSSFCAERLKALGDPLRLQIVDLLRKGEMTVSDIGLFLETEIVTVSHHLQILKHAQLVTPRREGRFIYYSLQENLLRSEGKSRQVLDLGCCRIEVPAEGKKR
jgi:DNA-binding transcriptional ArsR family regulator